MNFDLSPNPLTSLINRSPDHNVTAVVRCGDKFANGKLDFQFTDQRSIPRSMRFVCSEKHNLQQGDQVAIEVLGYDKPIFGLLTMLTGPLIQIDNVEW